jgi:choline dehydrogenase-like flavoprotein
MRYKPCLILLTYFFSVFSNPCLQANSADYVIVGVGTAGGLLAKMLSDDKESSVIALHIGPNLTQDPEIKFSRFAPTTAFSALFGPPFFEAGVTVPQPFVDNQQLPWAIALPFGGASSINAGAYVRGTNQLYAQWESIAGPLWSVKRITKIFKKLENYHGKTENPSVHGYHGPISVRQVSRPTKVTKTFTKAIIEGTGFPFVLDINDPKTPIGVVPNVQYTQKGCNGILRVSSATAFLNKKVMTPSGHGVNGRKLRVFFESTALRVIWEGNKAIGVEYLQNGETKTVLANKRVIVCAGLFSSPFLMHSGVGSASLLNSLNIPVIFDNPNVGQDLTDQTLLPIAFISNPADFPSHNINSPFDQITSLPDPDGKQNRRAIRFSTVTAVPGITLGFVDLLRPKSRGSITINSSDPLVPPVIDFGELSNPNDLTLYQKALQVYIKSINEALTASDPLYGLVIPDPAILDDILLVTDYIQQSANSAQSFQSHCRMAPQNQGGVVDSTGHVYGVENLIVADDSIVPTGMDGATMASAYLIAANIASILLSQGHTSHSHSD